MTPLRIVRWFAVGLFLAVAGHASADESKPNALTQRDIADGWILLFDGESAFGWSGKTEAKDGSLALEGKDATHFSIGLPAGELLCEVRNVRVTIEAGLAPLVDVVGPDAPFATVSIQRTVAGKKVETTIRNRANAAAKPASVSIEGLPPKAAWRPKFVGLANGGRVRSIRFKPADPVKLFNGKDLAGWKIFKDQKRSKSTWSVTPAGELALKNGPGDLQTEKQFDNFLFQLECKTNGAALNSGVFFRCLADQYQNGYEMQIQNAYKEGDRTKPADFGTGAIYRRIPARKVVSNDREWFAMTLLANGPRIATWVNGVPVVSWKDERAPDENPRKGLRTAKGHLSIQGHDPTTDLQFRNLRIVEIP